MRSIVLSIWIEVISYFASMIQKMLLKKFPFTYIIYRPHTQLIMNFHSLRISLTNELLGFKFLYTIINHSLSY